MRSGALKLALDGLMQRNTIRKPGESICAGRIGQPAEQALDAGPQVGEQRCSSDKVPVVITKWLIAVFSPPAGIGVTAIAKA